VAVGLAVLLPAVAGIAKKRAGSSFVGTQVRAQDPVTMERGLSRAELPVLRTMRSREAVWLMVAPSRAEWDRDVAEGLTDALAKSPALFRTWASFLPTTIGRAGPDVAGGLLHVELPDGRGRGLIGVYLPPLINDGRGGTALLNSPEPNRGRFVSGVDVSRASDGADRLLRGLFLPSWPSAVGRAGLAQVPLRPLPDGGRGALTLYRGAVGEEQGEALWDLAGSREVPLAPMETFPRKLGGLGDMLRSVRLDRPVVVADEGTAITFALAPSHWTVEERAVRHPTRYVALAAPVAVDLDGEEHAAAVGLVGFYTPLLMSADEASAWLGVGGEEFALAVHRGELPFFRDGSDLWFLRGWLQRWKAGEAREVGRKPMTPEQAADQARAWSKGKLRGIDRAAAGPLPQRFVPIPRSERDGLVDDRLVARARVDRDDLAAWLRRFEPTLKQGDREPAWTLTVTDDAAELPVTFSLERASAPERAVASSTAGGGSWETRGSSAGSSAPGAATATFEEADTAGPTSASFDGDLSLAILDLYADDGICRIGNEIEAALSFDVSGVPDGSTAKLRVEWDLIQDGTWIKTDVFAIERDAGSHEVEFTVACPKEEGPAELSLALLSAAHEDQGIETTLMLEVRPPGGRSWPALRMPDAKACLGAAASEGAADDEGFSMGGSQGLSGDQITSAVRGFQRQTLRCREGRTVSGTVQLELTVGCDGRVSSVDVLADGTDDSSFADCVARTMGYAGFPAHDLPDGAVFGLPLRFE